MEQNNDSSVVVKYNTFFPAFGVTWGIICGAVTCFAFLSASERLMEKASELFDDREDENKSEEEN